MVFSKHLGLKGSSTSQGIKILNLTDVLYPDTVGGAGRMAYHLCHELRKKGHEVHIMARNTDGNLPSYETLGPSLFVHRFFCSQRRYLSFLASEMKYSHRLVKELTSRISFDLVCVHQSLAAVGPLLSRRLKDVSLIYYFYSPWHEEFLIKRENTDGRTTTGTKAIAALMRWAEKRVMHRASRTIVMSQYMRNKILRYHLYPEERITEIPGGVDLEHFRLPAGGKLAAREKAQLTKDGTIFLTVRNLVPRMGLEALIEAFNQSDILRRKGRLLIGGQGPLRPSLESKVEEYHLQDSIRFLGHIPEERLPGLYQAADFFVLPTRELEGFGLVILEAMACGTPVLGTPVGAIPEILGKFDNRLIFDGVQWREMKHKLEQTIEKPDKFTFDPEACRKFVETNFSWKKMADAFEEEMLKLVQKQP
jgi:glycosyltransferase involved in cell wall biosynthesis